MLGQILSISSFLLGLYLLIVYLTTKQSTHPFQKDTTYHMGCFDTDSPLNHSMSIKNFLANVQSKNSQALSERESFSLMNTINYNDISKTVARDFQRFLSEYYQIKTKGVYEQNFYHSLNIAQEKFEACKSSVSNNFIKQNCYNSWNQFNNSKEQYQNIKNRLRSKITQKERQQQKMSRLILQTNFTDEQQFQKNINDQINNLNYQKSNFQTKKFDLINHRTPLEEAIETNKTKLLAEQDLLIECQTNIKIITFCNELNDDLKKLKLTFTKQDLQKKIQRKQLIKNALENAIKNAEKLNDLALIQLNNKNLAQNQQELKLLKKSEQDFKSYDESYCSKCSLEKINELRISITTTKTLLSGLQNELYRISADQSNLARQILIISEKIQRLEQQKDFHINRAICLTQQCQELRSKGIREEQKALNQMKKEALDYKFELQEHGIQHSRKMGVVNKWVQKVDILINCLNEKEYFEKLKNERPQHNENQLLKIIHVKDKLIKQLDRLGS